MQEVIKFFATGAYLGFLPKAPGTFGSFLGIPLAYVFLLFGQFFYLIATFVFVLLSIIIAELYDRQLEEHDSQTIVIDEVAGYLVALVAIPYQFQWPYILLAFVLFRIFDILKPFPLSYLDRIPGGIGIVLDDVGAGLMTNVILHLFIYLGWDINEVIIGHMLYYIN